MRKKCIIIAGPTAVGKTALAVELAQYFSTKIISADSRQCYRELNIGVAKPSQEELQRVHHYFINTLSVTEEFSAADYEAYSLDAAREIFLQNDIAVMVGGTGLYIKAFCDGLDEIPAIKKEVKEEVAANYEQQGLTYLREAIRIHDPVYFAEGDINNPQRLMRALEVSLSTGSAISSFQAKQKKQRDFDIIKIGLQLPRADLYNRINARVDEMMQAGLEEEARKLLLYRKLNALQTVGYRELFDYFDGLISLDKAVELIKQHTRHYAKRQMTWFTKDESITWCEPEFKNILEIIG